MQLGSRPTTFSASFEVSVALDCGMVAGAAELPLGETCAVSSTAGTRYCESDVRNRWLSFLCESIL